LKIRLRANHYDTVQASDGFSAIAVAQKEQPDLIILDLGLPAEDGLAVLGRLKGSETLSHIPVFVMTGRNPQFNEQEAVQAGATAFFQKPTDDSDLLDVISVTLSQARRTDAAVAVAQKNEAVLRDPFRRPQA
jgi:DNA-binding response OmpR family regulator